VTILFLLAGIMICYSNVVCVDNLKGSLCYSNIVCVRKLSGIRNERDIKINYTVFNGTELVVILTFSLLSNVIQAWGLHI